jgi:hypothetical protein
MAPVHQYRKLNRSRSSEVHQPVESGADGTPGEQHIIYKDNALAGQRKRISVRSTLDDQYDAANHRGTA